MKVPNVHLSFQRMIGLIVGLLLLLKSALLYGAYSYTFLPDSNLYVHLGSSLFRTGYISALVTLPYLFLNAIAFSMQSPVALLVLQIGLSAVVGGLFCFVIAGKNKYLAVVFGFLLVVDLVWGALTRSILTDGLFGTFYLASFTLLISHYDRCQHDQPQRIPAWELLLSGIFYAWTVSYRPSNIFLALLFPLMYLWLTRSWKQVIYLTGGLALFFFVIGAVNWNSSGKFYILAGGNSYTGSQTAFPLFVYRLYSPENGPASQKVDQILQECYPGLSYATMIDRSEGGAFDSVNNMVLINKQVIPCIQKAEERSHQSGSLLASAYIEAYTKHPIQSAGILLHEEAVFLKYNNPYILRWLLAPSKNYGCDQISWCEQINQGSLEWSGANPLSNAYEKIATKLLQAYLWPVGLLSRILPDKEHIPFLAAWFCLAAFLILATRGWLRFLTILSFCLIQYTSLVVIAGLGFTERYAAMLSPIQAVLSGVAYWVIAQYIWRIVCWMKNRQLQFGFGGRRDTRKLPTDPTA